MLKRDSFDSSGQFPATIYYLAKQTFLKRKPFNNFYTIQSSKAAQKKINKQHARKGIIAKNEGR